MNLKKNYNFLKRLKGVILCILNEKLKKSIFFNLTTTDLIYIRIRSCCFGRALLPCQKIYNFGLSIWCYTSYTFSLGNKMDLLVVNEQQRLLSLEILTQIVEIKNHISALETTYGKLVFIMKQIHVPLTTEHNTFKVFNF